MLTIQNQVFSWAAQQATGTGALLLALGLFYGFMGFRFFRILQLVAAAAVGYLAGLITADAAGMDATLTGSACGVALSLLTLVWHEGGVWLIAAATGALLGLFLGQQFGFPPQIVLVCGAGVAGLGVLFVWLCRRSTQVVLTTAQGAMLTIVGFVAFTSAAIPTIGETFRAWAAEQFWLTPLLLTMVAITAYSYQSMVQQGDMRSGT